jgi:FkbM family methyltransferase
LKALNPSQSLREHRDDTARKKPSSVLAQVRSIRTHVQALGIIVGLIRWFRASVLGHRSPFTHLTGFSALSVSLRLGSSDIEVFKKIFIDKEYEQPFQSAPHTILDLGANIGLSSVFFANTFPNACVIAVEPDPANFALLQHNVAKLPNVTCVHAAVWPQDGRVRLSDPGLGHWAMRVTQGTDPGFDVPALSMESLLAMLPSGRADLVKIDIEGAEKELFSEPHAWLDQVQSMVIELHDRYQPGCSRAFFNAVQSFPHEQWCGENIWVWRDAPPL